MTAQLKPKLEDDPNNAGVGDVAETDESKVRSDLY